MKREHPDPVDVYVGRRVRTRRLLVGMNQSHLAEHLGVTFQQLQKYEKGANRISAGRLQQAARLLGVPVAYFFEGEPGGSAALVSDAMSSSSTVVSFLSTKEGVQLNRAFTRITNRKLRRHLIAFVEALTGDD